jgi:hypothetical protein
VDDLQLLDVSVVAVVATVLGTWALLMVTERGRRALAVWEPGRGVFLLTAAGLVAIAVWMEASVPLRQDLDGGDIERLYRASAVSAWRHLLFPDDYHHPGLWFALLHWPFVHTGHALWVPAAFDRGMAILAIPLAGWVVATCAGRLAALAAMANIALLPLLALQAREVSDVTLFVALGLFVLLASLRAQEPGRRGWSLAFAVSIGLLINTSYAAPMLLGALLLDILADRHRRKTRLVPFLAGCLLGSPRLVHFIQLLPLELRIRRETSHIDWYWGSTPFGTFLRDAMSAYFSPFAVILLPLFVLACLLAPRTLRRRGALVAGVAISASVLLLQSVFRIRDYYALLLPILTLLLVASLIAGQEPGERESRAAVRRGVALAASLLCVAAFTDETISSWSQWMRRETRPDYSRLPIQAAIADGAQVLVYDSAWQMATWNFLQDRWGTMDRCYRFETPCFGPGALIRDVASSRSVRVLAGRFLTASWETEAAADLQALQKQSVVYLLVYRNLPNQNVLAYVEQKCATLAQAGEFETWKCPRLEP